MNLLAQGSAPRNATVNPLSHRSEVKTILRRINVATKRSPIAVFLIRSMGSSRSNLCDVFGATVETQKLARTHEGFLGFFDKTMDIVEVNKNLRKLDKSMDTHKGVVRVEKERKHTKDVRLITAKGKTQTLSKWAEELGISFQTLSARLNKGWSIEDALDKVVKNGSNQHNDTESGSFTKNATN